MIPSHRPDGEVTVAFWTPSSPVPRDFASRLIYLGQCQEFWCTPGTMNEFGGDWRKGPLSE